MSLVPFVSGVFPEPGDTDTILNPTVRVTFTGLGLIDPRSFTSGTFAIFGPGDVTAATGPGTILDSGIKDDPYTLIDGAIIRECVEGDYLVHTSGFGQLSGVVVSGNIGVSGVVTYGLFTPDKPLQANTVYTAVLLGDDALDWLTTDQSFPGVTSWTSEATWTASGVPQPSGTLTVINSYNRTLPTSAHVPSTGYNDTYNFEVLIGSTIGEPEFIVSKTSDGSAVTGSGPGPHQLFNEGVKFTPSGLFNAGERFYLDVYIPQPLVDTFVWSFDTGELNLSTPPITPTTPSLVVDTTPGGGIGVDSTAVDNTLRLIETWPPHLDYDVAAALPYILLKFNKTLHSGLTPPGLGSVQIRSTPLLGLPHLPSGFLVTPSSLEISGQYLKVNL